MHCEVDAQAAEDTLLELATELFELDEEDTTLLELTTELFELEDGVELEETVELELKTELFELDAELGAELLLAASEHTAPVITGFSATEPFLSP